MEYRINRVSTYTPAETRIVRELFYRVFISFFFFKHRRSDYNEVGFFSKRCFGFLCANGDSSRGGDGKGRLGGG